MVEGGDITPARGGEAEVAGGDDAAVAPGVQPAQARIGDAVEKGGRLVGRAVIDDEQFEIPEPLTEDTVDAGADGRGAVVGRHQYADAGCGHGSG